MRSSWVGSRVRRDRVRGAGIDARGRCAAVPEETLAILKSGAEEALAADGVERTRLGYGVLVKLKGDELLERESRRMGVKDHRERSRERLRTPAPARLQCSA
jgi:hypothetical protein